MATINSKLSIPDFSSVKELSNGTGSLQNGMNAITSGLKKIDNGIDKGAAGADSLYSGISKLKNGVSRINGGMRTISGKIAQINNGYTALGKGYKSLPTYIGQLKLLTAIMQINIIKINSKLPNDPDVKNLNTMLSKLSSSLSRIDSAINTANSNYDMLTAGLYKVNAGLKTIIANTDSQSKLVTGINDLEKGAESLSEGLKKGSSGQKQVIASMTQLKKGAGKIKTGQNTLYNGLNSLSTGMMRLKSGINKSSDGLTTISKGISKSGDFLTQLTNTKNFYIPKEVYDKTTITKILDMYMSKDRKTAKLTVTLTSEPYANNSINLINEIKTFTVNQLKGTELADTKVGIAGSTSNSNDLRNIATHDIIFTQIIVLSAIFILLIIVIRSFWIPVYIIGSLITAYYTSLSATSYISKFLFNSAKEGLSWNVPFFAFIMIAALGVDYSIFLMTRFREYPELSQKEAIVIAAKNIGSVVIAAKTC